MEATPVYGDIGLEGQATFTCQERLIAAQNLSLSALRICVALYMMMEMPSVAAVSLGLLLRFVIIMLLMFNVPRADNRGPMLTF